MLVRISLTTLLTLLLFEIAMGKTPTATPLVTLAAYPPMLKIRSLVDSLSGTPVHRKDYKSLIQAAPDLSSACTGLLEMKYSSHNTKKVESFRSHRDELGRLVVEYTDAASSSDSVAVCSLVPKLRAQCDSVTRSLLPVPWKAFDRLRMTLFEAFGKPPITDDRKALTRALTKTRNQLSNFIKSKPPSEISNSLAVLIPPEKDVFAALAARMIASLEMKDLSKFKLQATELNTRLMNFSLSYLQ